MKEGRNRVIVLAVLISSCFTVLHAQCPYSKKRVVVAASKQRHVDVSSDDDGWAGQIPFAGNMSDPLVLLNNKFIDIYSDSGKDQLPSTVIITENDYLVLVKNGTRVRMDPINTEHYHNLKMASHIAFSSFLLCLPYVKDPKTIPFPHDELEQYITSVRATLPSINAQRFPNTTSLNRQIELANHCLTFLEAVYARNDISQDELYSFASGVMIYINPNIEEAVKSQLDCMNAVVKDWRANVLTDNEWNGLRFILHSSHMALNNSVNIQFFSRVLSQDPSHPSIQPNTYNKRMIELDDIVINENDALSLLGTHLNDYATSMAFFNSTYRMHRDLLGDAATKYLDVLFPPIETPHTVP